MKMDSQVCGFRSQGPKAAEAASPDDGTGAGNLVLVPWATVHRQDKAQSRYWVPSPRALSPLGGSGQVGKGMVGSWLGLVFPAQSTGRSQALDTVCPLVDFEVLWTPPKYYWCWTPPAHTAGVTAPPPSPG